MAVLSPSKISGSVKGAFQALCGFTEQSIHQCQRQLGRFRSDQDGAVVFLFALSLLPMLAVTGGAVDYGLASSKKVRLQSALDAATLSATRSITSTSTSAQITETIRSHLRANFDSSAAVSLSVNVDVPGRSIIASATLQHPTNMLPIIGINNITIGADSSSNLGRAYIELALVLDNSGSMAGNRIETLRSASADLMRKVLSLAYMPGDTRVGIVPFASMVNVGAGNANQTWIDGLGLSPIHSENFAPAANRLALYSSMVGAPWGGCVETRPSPHDVTDSVPSEGNPATLFVPSFAPDEPDTGNGFSNFFNSYLPDTCTGVNGGSLTSRQQRVCKYAGATPDQSLANGTRRGPNQMCDSNPIVPLTSNQATLTAALSQMPAYGGTNLMEGLTWGWRVLSPERPFTEGRPYNDPQNRKILVLMTDGSNDIIGLPNMNGSMYSSFGYSAAGRLGAVSNDKSALVARMNEKTLTACANAKAAGILVYTVAFYVTDATARDLLQRCASNASMALVAESEQGLVNAFAEIGNHIARLRLTK